MNTTEIMHELIQQVHALTANGHIVTVVYDDHTVFVQGYLGPVKTRGNPNTGNFLSGGIKVQMNLTHILKVLPGTWTWHLDAKTGNKTLKQI